MTLINVKGNSDNMTYYNLDDLLFFHRKIRI